MEDFKYMVSTVQNNRECGREVKNREHAGWNGWMSGVVCNRRGAATVKGKVYKVAVRLAMLYGLETVALTKRQEAEHECGRVEDVTLCIRSDRNGQDQELVHQRDSTGGTV